MQPVFFVLAVMGCGDGNAGCVPVRVEPARYATMAQCRAELPAALTRNTDVDYPVVSADCRRSSPLVIAAKGKGSAKG